MRSAQLQRYDSLICSSSKVDLTSPKTLLRLSKESMRATSFAHLSQVEGSGGDTRESEEEEGQTDGAEEAIGGGGGGWRGGEGGG